MQRPHTDHHEEQTISPTSTEAINNTNEPDPRSNTNDPTETHELLHSTDLGEPFESNETTDTYTESTQPELSSQPSVVKSQLDIGENTTLRTLILAPAGKAIAGNGGIASSETYSRAILRANTSAVLLYKPSSVAVAGAGGKAHAQSVLDIWIM